LITVQCELTRLSWVKIAPPSPWISAP